MAKRIRRSEISEEDLFKDIRDSALETIKTLKKLDEVFKNVARAAKGDLGGTGKDDSAAIKRKTSAIQKANKAKKGAMQLDRQIAAQQKQVINAEIQLERIKREKLKTEREELRNATQLAKEKERQAKVAERAAKAAKDENDAYKKLVRQTRELKNQSKTLAATLLELEKKGRQNTKEYRNLRREYKQVTKAAKEGDSALKGIDARVGDNFRNVGNYTQALGKLRNGLGQLGLAFGAFQLIRGAAGIVKDFDQAQGDLQAISGKTKEELAALTDQAKELGATTQFSATQITEMQIELAKLGFTSQQISDSTGAVANFAAATGADIPQAAALAGSALRGFGLEAAEMDRVVSTLGVATTKSALSFESLNSGLSTIAPVAASFGFSIEDTTALLGQLANAGFDASSAATATRNILLNLADSSGDLAQELGRPIKSAEDLAAGLQELDARGIDLAEALELTDKRSVAAFSTFIKGSKDLVGLKDSITDVNDELEAMAEKRLDTISGQFTLLSSAWEGFILSLNEGTGVGAAVKNMIGFIAENLSTILGIIGRVTLAFVAYRIVMSKAATNLLNFSRGVITSVKNLKRQDISLKTIGKTARAAGTAFKTMGKALQSIAFIAIATAIYEVATALWDTVSGARELREETARQKQALEDQKKAAEASTEALQKKIQAEKDAIALAVSNGLTEKDALKRAEKFLASEKNKLEIQKKISDQLIIDLKAKQKQLDVEKAANDEVLKATQYQQGYSKEKDEGSKKARELEKRQSELSNEMERAKVIAGALEEQTIFLNGEVFENTIATNNNRRSTKENTKAKKELNTELKTEISLLKELNDLYARQAEAQTNLKELDLTQQITEINDKLAEATAIQRANIEQDNGFTMENITELAERRKDLEIQLIETRRDADIKASKDAFDQRFVDLRAALQKDLEEQKKANEKSGRSKAEILAANKKLEDDFRKKSAEIDQLEVEEEKTLNAEIIVIKETANNEILAIEKNTAEEINEIDKELTDQLIARGEELKKIDEENAKKALEAEKKLAEQKIAIIDAITDKAIEASDKRIAKLDDEIAAAQKQQDFFRELAAQGNIDAEQSLAEQAKIEREAQKQKQEELKRQARIQLASSAYTTYQSKVAAGSDQPLADTIKDITFLQGFIQSLPLFEAGTEDTGTHGQGVDGRGGFHAILHPNERVMTKSQNAMIGDMSNMELAKLAQEYNAGKIIAQGEGASQLTAGWDNSAILAKLNELNKTIQDKPEYDMKVEEVLNGVMKIRKTERRGNNIIHNRYRMK